MTLMKISACGSACILTVLWAVGAAGLTLFFLLGYLRALRALSGARQAPDAGIWLSSCGIRFHRTISIRLLDDARTPLTYGLGRPVVVLPEHLETDVRRRMYILTHELVHIRSLDCLRKWLLTSARCVHWFNPLVWLMVYTANRDLELACDGTVLRLLGDGSRKAYAGVLLEFAARKRPELAFGSGFGQTAAEERIHHIMKYRKTSYCMELLPNTVKLSLLAVVIAIIVSIPLGINAAIHQNTWADTGSMFTSLLFVSMPQFWLGLLLMLAFALKLGWFPSGGNEDGLKSLILPAFTVGIGLAALMTRTTRSSMLETIRQDYITTAKAKGVSNKNAIYHHAFKNALIPIVTVGGMQLAQVLGGSVLAETVFSYPGVGRLIVQSIERRDIPMVTGALILTTIIVSVVNLATDIVYAFIDPRIKSQYARK